MCESWYCVNYCNSSLEMEQKKNMLYMLLLFLLTVTTCYVLKVSRELLRFS